MVLSFAWQLAIKKNIILEKKVQIMNIIPKEKLFTGDFAKIFFAGTLLFISFYMLLPTLPVYITQVLFLDTKSTGLLLAIYTIAALIIRPFVGFFIDKYGRKIYYIVSFAIFSLLFSGYFFAISLVLMLIVRFLHGLAWGVTTTSASTLIVDVIPAHRRGEGIGLYGLSMTIPMALGPLLGLEISQRFGFPALFFSALAFSTLGFLIAIQIKYPKYEVKPHLKFRWQNLIEKTSIPITLNLLLVNIGYGGLVAFVSLYAIETGVGHAAVYFIVFAAGITIARLYGGKIFDRKGPYQIVIFGIAALVAGYLFLGFIKSLETFFLAALLSGLGSGVVFPAFQAMVNNIVTEQRRGAANSTLFTGLDLGIGVGMLVTGWLGQIIGFANTYLIFSGLSVFALLFFIFVSFRHYEKNMIR